jgi:26 proteasome complex subunit DSS1
MNKSEKSAKENQANPKDKNVNQNVQIKLGLFEEDDYFEEFEDEEWNEGHVKEDIDLKQWQEEWEDEEINDQFEVVMKREIEAFKAGK